MVTISAFSQEGLKFKITSGELADFQLDNFGILTGVLIKHRNLRTFFSVAPGTLIEVIRS